MNTKFPFAAVLCGTILLSGCAYDDHETDDIDDDDNRSRRVRVSSVSTVAPVDYYGDYDEYTPYYSYSGRRYYRSNNRYVYYDQRRPYYVTTLPARSAYITPPRSTTVRVVRESNRNSPDWPR